MSKSDFPTTCRCIVLALCGWFALSVAVAGETAIKPAHTVIRPGYDPHRITVKFRDGLHVRLRNNVLVSTNAQLFASSQTLFSSLSAGKWERADALSEQAIDQMRQRAQQRLGRALHDLNLQFYLTLPAGMEAGSVIDQLNQLDIVELAQPVPLPQPPPLPPNYEPRQTNCFPSPVGGGIFQVWSNYGVFGAGVRVADVEYSFNSSHEDLPSIVNLDTNAIDPFDDNNHGTATLGEMSALENGWGITGIGYGASFYFAGANYTNGYDVGRGITTAASALRPGDFILVEQQIPGPNTTQALQDGGSQYTLVPVDWCAPFYDRIVTAVGNGIIVIEAAGNGGQNLDDPIYSTGNGGLWPFCPPGRSGALFVGAGASANGRSTESSRLDYSNYGSCVDLQEWGENIFTTGYGDLYDSEGTNLFYTATFGGTSGATPIAVGEAVLLQSIYENATGETLSSGQIRALLRNCARPQTGGAYTAFENIGPMPDLPASISVALATSGPPVIVAQTTNAVALIGGTATLSVAATGGPPVYQWSFQKNNLTDGATVFGANTADVVLTSLTVAEGGNYAVTISNAQGIASASVALAVISDPALTPGVLLTNIYTFTDLLDGSGPVGLTPDGAGNFYGMQEYGGSGGYGGIFEFTPATGAFTELYAFNYGTDGAYPYAPLVLGSDGNFYGTTSTGGQSGCGAIFSFSPAGNLNVLDNFTVADGETPLASLVEASPGLFYGTTHYGGTGYGVVFSVDSSGSFTVVHAFDYNDGSGPWGGLVQAGDGNFYGTTRYGGSNNDGTIYRIDPSGGFESLFSFVGGNGSSPCGNLVQGLDGKLYGRTYDGGAYNQGTVYSFTTNGVFQSLFSFDGTNGANPFPSLIAGNDGNLYGLTESGGTNGGDGVIYEVTPSGAFDVVARFSGLNGVRPFAPIVRGEDGDFYGTTYSGNYGYGNIFRLSFATTPPPAFQAAVQSSGQISLTWSAVAGRSYQLQSTTNLAAPDWLPLGAPSTATNTVWTATDSVTENQKFYRAVMTLP
jgi:uncharacterized repeat protein (TIGR03803 family)